MKSKKCVKCKKTKTLKEFYKHKKNSDGHSYDCKKCRKKRVKQWQDKNKKKVKGYKDKWVNENPNYYKQYYQNNKEKRNEYKRNRYNNDPSFKITENYRNRIAKLISRGDKSETTKELLGCSSEKFKEYIEEQFTDDMNWDNYGTYWQVDHIIPLNLFNMKNKEERLYAFNYRNCRPLKSEENNARPWDGSDLQDFGSPDYQISFNEFKERYYDS